VPFWSAVVCFQVVRCRRGFVSLGAKVLVAVDAELDAGRRPALSVAVAVMVTVPENGARSGRYLDRGGGGVPERLLTVEWFTGAYVAVLR